MKDLFKILGFILAMMVYFTVSVVYIAQNTSEIDKKTIVKSCETLNGFTVGNKVYDCKLNREIK
jgi:hypothetical protein